MEESHKKRLNVFRAITRDFSPGSFKSDCSFEVPESSPLCQLPLTNSSSHQGEGSDYGYFPTLFTERVQRRLPLTEPGGIPSTKANIPVRVLASLEPRSACESFHRKAVPSLDARRGEFFLDTSLNTSGSLSSRSQHLNMSTEESSREELEERGKPKKRPLEEGERSFYIIRLDCIKNSEDTRTTIMIKNIPNKYTQKMLIQTIDRKFSGTYDFLYLPIDFKVFFI